MEVAREMMKPEGLGHLSDDPLRNAIQAHDHRLGKGTAFVQFRHVVGIKGHHIQLL